LTFLKLSNIIAIKLENFLKLSWGEPAWILDGRKVQNSGIPLRQERFQTFF
jgi:hypothetical protein